MPLQKTVSIGPANLDFYYKVHNCCLFRDSAKVEITYWYSRDDYIAGVPFAGAEQYTAVDIEEQRNDANEVIVEAVTAYTDYFDAPVTFEEGLTPRQVLFKRGYVYLKTLPEFANATDVDV